MQKDKTIILFNMRNGSHYTLYNQSLTIAYNQTSIDLKIDDKNPQFEAGDLCYLRVFNQQTIPCWYASNDNDSFKFKTVYDLFNEENSFGFDYTKMDPTDALITYLNNSMGFSTEPGIDWKIDASDNHHLKMPTIDSDSVKSYFEKIVKTMPVTFTFDPSKRQILITFNPWPYFAKNIVVLNGTNNNIVDLYKNYQFNGSALFNNHELQNKLYISTNNQITTDPKYAIKGTLKNNSYTATTSSFADYKSSIVGSLSSSNSAQAASLSSISSSVVRPYEIYSSLVSENSSYQSSLASQKSSQSSSATTTEVNYVYQLSEDKRETLNDYLSMADKLVTALVKSWNSNFDISRAEANVERISFNAAQIKELLNSYGIQDDSANAVRENASEAMLKLSEIRKERKMGRKGAEPANVINSLIKKARDFISGIKNKMVQIKNTSPSSSATYNTPENPVFNSLASNNNSYVAQFNTARNQANNYMSAAIANQSIANSYSAQAYSANSNAVQSRISAIAKSSNAFDLIRINNNGLYNQTMSQYNSLIDEANSYASCFNENYAMQRYLEGIAISQESQANSYISTALSNSYSASLTASFIDNFNNLNLNQNPYASAYRSYQAALADNKARKAGIDYLSSDSLQNNDVEIIGQNIDLLLKQISNTSFTIKTSSLKDLERQNANVTYSNGNYNITDRINVYVPNLGITFTSIITSIKYISSSEAELSCGFLYSDLKGFIRKIAKGEI